ncbi:hypothetical protein LTR56_019819 [Elasticomyces elasticus]|nr:hypothetical protein LTR56_019819 [Elasticomyces elasticus]KAK3633571.1 hypothetical protein LTR22_020083 [Elasticomyces elasticus]KAK4910741.1 hypothetical protein LTR49_020593 [Elasticomyces elasticus]KAK5762216.1 hypothetical protein LTS12_007559 [Elasticomyces elasticus]
MSGVLALQSVMAANNAGNPSLAGHDDGTIANAPTVRLLAASWAGLMKDGSTTAANKVEKIGNLVYGDGLFKAAMSDAVGGHGQAGDT